MRPIHVLVILLVIVVLIYQFIFSEIVTESNINEMERRIAADVFHEIAQKGTDIDRFIICDIRPSTIMKRSESHATLYRPYTDSHVYTGKDEFERDNLHFNYNSKKEEWTPVLWLTNTIHRFDGAVKIDDYIFINDGEPKNRLTFLVMGKGYVYLRGKGRVLKLNSQGPRDYDEIARFDFDD